jgi:hypothetical protein
VGELIRFRRVGVGGDLVGALAQEQAGLELAFETWLVPYSAPRRDDDQRDRGKAHPDADLGYQRVIHPAQSLSGGPRPDAAHRE